jgi:hypothetical protein
MTNDEKDRHVAAAAVHGEAGIILTLNLHHFRPEHLATWRVRALHPQSFLIEIFRQEQVVVLTKLEQQAADRGRSLSQLLDILNATMPDSLQSFWPQPQSCAWRSTGQLTGGRYRLPHRCRGKRL